MKIIKFYKLARNRKVGLKQGNYSNYIKFQEFQAKEIVAELKKRKIDLKNKKVLELGAGMGGYSRIFKKSSKELIINDISKPYALKLDPSLKFKQFNVTRKFPFKDNSFDFVFACSLIEHVEKPDKMIKEIGRVLKPRGMLYLSFPPFYSPIGGHYFKPFHLFGEKVAIFMAKTLKNPLMTKKVTSFKNCYGNHGLFIRTIGSIKKLLINKGFTVGKIWTRFSLINTAKIPILKEFLTWHVCFLVRNNKK